MSNQDYGQPPGGSPPGQPPGYPPGAPAGAPPGYPAAPPGGQPLGYQMGGPLQGMPPQPGMDKPKMEPMALIAMITGIVSILCIFPGCCCGLWFISPAPAIAGIVLGIMGRNKINQDPEKLTGQILAIVGIICGAVAILAFLVWIVLYALGISAQLMQQMSQSMGR